MVGNLSLYINDKLVDFSTDPQVLYTYQQTDVTNPTAVKNSFSKTITIDGTPNNNDIFGHYWNVERYLLNGGEGGAYFNSSKKAPFQIFVGSDLYEEGYCKLDNINKVGGVYKYEITLYGGLGDFFWNLSASDDGDAKKLSDLTFMPEGGQDEFDFTANIDAVNTAWGVLGGRVNPHFEGNAKWQYINFMPAYNGIPSDFDADKIVINTSGTTIQKSAKNADDEKWYSVKNGWTIGTLPQEMTEWEIRDLRSYLQRPCIKMSAIVNACCNPSNNGGYTVDLDPDFFSESNPYWTRTWLSLPMVQNLEYNNEEQILEGAELLVGTTTGETNGLMYQSLRFDLGEINSNVSSISLKTKINIQTGLGYSSYIWFWNWNGDSAHPNWICFGSLFCQLLAVNGDTVVGASEVYNLTSPVRHNGNLYYGHNGHYPESTGIDPQTGRRKMGNGTQFIPYMDQPIYNVLGNFSPFGFKKEISHTSSGSTFASEPYEFTFNITNISGTITGLKMVYYWGASEQMVKKFSPGSLFQSPYHNGWLNAEYMRQTTLASGLSLNIVSHNMSAVLGESLGRTGTKVTKALLLNTESSPCDYLLSYCKMFGLHFTKDVGEKRIHIMTRNTFYNRGEVVDLNNLIDRSKDINITPILFKSKWYQFLQEKDESALQKKYLTTKGVEYGCKILDTGYQFSAEKIDLLKGNCIKSGIEGLEKSKFYTAYNNDASLRPWMNLGLKYTLWNDVDTFEYNAGVGNSGTILPINEGQGLKYYDIIPKLQFHDDSNGPTDGNNCLVFYSGFKSTVSGRTNPLNYILSDDNAYQTDLNEGTPCWLFTKDEVVNGKRICYKLERIPVFERYLTDADSGTILKSLDFGSAQELYVPGYSLTDDVNIYHAYWDTYLTDLFDINTKQMSCYVKINEKPGVDWLRRFYWFDNAIWVANKISDWNVASYGTTKVEFIKVQDASNYTSMSPQELKTLTLSISAYDIPVSGGSVTLTVTCGAGVSWRLGVDNEDITLSRTGGTGTGTVTAYFPENEGSYPVVVYFTATRTDNAYSTRVSARQGYEGEKFVRVVPGDIIVPASGGSVEVDFVWYNQGDSYIYDIDFNEGEEYLQFIVDYTTKRDENKAILYFNENTGNTVLHNYCTFCDYDHDACTSIGIDQLPYEYRFSNGGDEAMMTVSYNAGAVFDDVPYWLTIVDNGDNTYTMVSRRNDGEDRRGVVRMTKETSATFNVYQGGMTEFSVTRVSGSGNIQASGETVTLQVLCTENPWTVISNDSWCVPAYTSSTESAELDVVIAENTDDTRQAVLTFINANGEEVQFTLMQQGAGSSATFLTPDTKQMSKDGGTYGLTINTRHTWTVTGTPAWVSLSQTGGTGSASIIATVAQNTGANVRTGTISVYDNDASRTYVSSIIQLGTADTSSLVIEPNPLTASVTGGTYPITLSYLHRGDDVPTVTTSDAHISISDVVWNGDVGTARVTVSENTGTSQYSGTVVFSGVESATLTVTQPGATAYLSVSPASIDFRPSGGTATIIINTNTDWTIL